ncbi:hypothetical protein GCM10009734_63430 [Nonomuraea bangladeshensis]
MAVTSDPERDPASLGIVQLYLTGRVVKVDVAGAIVIADTDPFSVPAASRPVRDADVLPSSTELEIDV